MNQNRSEPFSRMRIVVLGAGALGTLIGGLLARSNDVTILGRPTQVAAIRRRGVKIVGASRTTTHPKASVTADGLAAPELLLLAVKAYDTESALEGVNCLIRQGTVVLSLQNGITTKDALQRCVPRANLLLGWTSHGAVVVRPGVVRHAGTGDTVLGEPDNRNSERARTIAGVLSRAGIATSVSKSIQADIWLKGIVNSVINPLTAMLRCENARVGSDEALAPIIRSICEEGATVARAEGFDVSTEEAVQRTLRVSRQTALNRSSMLRDLELGRRTEIGFLNGAIAELARMHGIKAPVNEAMASIICSMENGPGIRGGK